jgi:hypothetical protein
MSPPKSSMTMATLAREGASGGPGGAGGIARKGGGDGEESARESFSPVPDEGGSLPDGILAAFEAVWDLSFADFARAEDEAPEERATLEFAAFEGSAARRVACRDAEATLLRALGPTDLPVSPQ